MKKYYSVLMAACLLTACDDWTEKNFDIENAATPENVIVKDYTLTDDDYSTIASLKIDGIDKDALAAVKKNKYLTPQTPVDSVLPALMAKKYYSASEGTVITTTYLLAAETPEYLAKMERASSYEVSAEEYAKVWGDEKTPYFTPAKSAEANLPALLKAGLPDAAEKDYATVSYKYSATEPVPEIPSDKEEVVLLSESFEASQGDFTLENTVLPEELSFIWKYDSKNKYMKASAFANNTKYVAESWMISPAIDMSGVETATLTFDHVTRFGKKDHSDLTLVVSTDYTGGLPSNAHWETVAIPVFSDGSNWNFVNSGEVVLDNFAGKENVHIAFKYNSDEKAAGTWEVKNIVVSAIAGSAQGGNYEEGTVFSESFKDNQGNFTIDNIVMPEEVSFIWKYNSYGYMKASAFVNKVNYATESMLISPEIDLKNVKQPVLSFSHAYKYGKDASKELTLWVAVDGGDYTQLIIPNYPSGSDWTMVSSGDIDLAAYMGKKIKIAFKYISTAEGAATWEIKDVAIMGLMKASKAKTATKAAVPTETRYAFYQYDGEEWAEVKNAAIVNPADYTAMGASNPNFSATFAADNYLPAFMGLKFPYAQDGDVKTAVYHYFASGNTSLRADDYLYKAGEWVKNRVPVDSAVSRCLYRGGKWIVAPDAVFALDFESVGKTSPADIPGWTTVGVKGNTWYTTVYNDNAFARCSGYGGGGVTETWLITPAIALPEGYDLQFTFDCEVGYFTQPCLTVLISTDFAGDQTTATWTDITEHFTLPTSPTSGYGTFANVGGFDLKEYLGKTIYIAFRLDGDSDDNKTTTYDIDNVSVGVVF